MAALKSLDIVYASHHMRKLLIIVLLSSIVVPSYHLYSNTWTLKKMQHEPMALKYKRTLDKFWKQHSFGTTSAYRCDERTAGKKTKRKLEFQTNSRSQSQEDKTLLQFFFRGICGGIYIELGALDGLRLSNSYYFGKALDWRGILIEPNPQSFEKLKVNRPEDDLYNYAICSKEKDVHFVEGYEDATSGIYEFMPLTFKQQWHGRTEVKDLQKIKCRRLSSVIATSKYRGLFIDFLSLDVEGGEFEVLKTINFEEDRFGVIFYEADDHNPIKNEAIKTFLEKKGYIFRFHVRGSNYHVNQNWDTIYGGILQ